MFQHIATCWHVVDPIKSDDVWVRVNNKEGRAVLCHTRKERWYKHPLAEGRGGQIVDLCVTPITLKDDEYDILHIPVDLETHVATDTTVQSEAIGIGDEVYAVGLFTSHYGEISNLPTVRCGTIAAMLHEPIDTVDGFVDGYLIELHSVGGLSGSPAFVHMAPLRVVDGEMRQSRESDHYFLGMIQGHFQVDNPLDVVVADKKAPVGIFNTGMCVVIPVKRILEAINHPVLKAEREEIVENKRKSSGFTPDAAATPDMEPSTKADNPQHREDFNRLLAAVTKGPQSDGET